MFAYKDKYIFKYERDINGEIFNKDDNFIACRQQGKIYRYSTDILTFVSPKRIRIKNTDTEGNILWDYTDLILEVIDTDAERIIRFKEENLEKLEDLFKIRKRREVELTDEQREVIKNRLMSARGKE